MKLKISLVLASLPFIFPPTAHAVCPVCTVAVAGGLGISRMLGIDDSVTGIWVGGIIISSGLWLASFIKKRKLRVPYPGITSMILFFLLVIPPLYWAGLIGLAGNTLLGVDKIVLGTAVGSALFVAGVSADKLLRLGNGGKVYIYYQKVIIPVFLLTLGSFVFYLLTL